MNGVEEVMMLLKDYCGPEKSWMIFLSGLLTCSPYNQELKKCKVLNIVLSKKKFIIGSTLPFAGYIVSDQGVQPNQERVVAIRHFPYPKDQTGIKSFLGLAK